MNTKLLFLLPLLWLAACATVENNAYRTIGTTAHTVDILMENWADASVAGRTSPEIDNKVMALHAAYQRSALGARVAVEALRAGTGSQGAVDTALAMLAQNKQLLSALIVSLVAPEKKATLEKLP